SVRCSPSLPPDRICTMLARCLAITAALFPASLLAAEPADKVDYNFHVRPILADRCFKCHGPDDRARKAKLRLDTRDGALEKDAFVPGDPDDSELIRRITSDDEKERMPPAASKLHVSKEEVEVLKRWIKQGAEYKPHWAFLLLPDHV